MNYSSGGGFTSADTKVKELFGNGAWMILQLIKYAAPLVVLYCIFLYETSGNNETKRSSATTWGMTALILGVLAWAGIIDKVLSAFFK